MKRQIIVLVIVALTIAFFDQLTKYLVVSTMNLYESVSVLGDLVKITFIYNQNGAFGLAPQKLLPFLHRKIFYIIFSLLAGFIVLYMYFKTEPADKWSRAALMLIAGGAVGNFIDRIRMGRVVDFIDCDFPDFIMERWPVFNVADSCVTVGIAILIVVTLLSKKHGTKHQKAG
jgi:signal peptidase II